MDDLSPLQREILLSKLTDEEFSQMTEEWAEALDNRPLAEWPPEMVKFLAHRLPSSGLGETDE